jgi:hypothetical protein
VKIAPIPAPFPPVAAELAMIAMQLLMVVRHRATVVVSAVVPQLPAIAP